MFRDLLGYIFLFFWKVSEIFIDSTVSVIQPLGDSKEQ